MFPAEPKTVVATQPCMGGSLAEKSRKVTKERVAQHLVFGRSHDSARAITMPC